MGALIYNSQTGVFEDAEVPKAEVNGMWVDTVGMNHNGTEWVNDWDDNYILLPNGLKSYYPYTFTTTTEYVRWRYFKDTQNVDWYKTNSEPALAFGLLCNTQGKGIFLSTTAEAVQARMSSFSASARPSFSYKGVDWFYTSYDYYTGVLQNTCNVDVLDTGTDVNTVETYDARIIPLLKPYIDEYIKGF